MRAVLEETMAFSGNPWNPDHNPSPSLDGPELECNGDAEHGQKRTARRQQSHAQAQYAHRVEQPFVLFRHRLDDVGGRRKLLLQFADLGFELLQARSACLGDVGLRPIPYAAPQLARAARDHWRRHDQLHPRYSAENRYPAWHETPFCMKPLSI